MQRALSVSTTKTQSYYPLDRRVHSIAGIGKEAAHSLVVSQREAHSLFHNIYSTILLVLERASTTPQLTLQAQEKNG